MDFNNNNNNNNNNNDNSNKSKRKDHHNCKSIKIVPVILVDYSTG